MIQLLKKCFGRQEAVTIVEPVVQPVIIAPVEPIIVEQKVETEVTTQIFKDIEDEDDYNYDFRKLVIYDEELVFEQSNGFHHHVSFNFKDAIRLCNDWKANYHLVLKRKKDQLTDEEQFFVDFFASKTKFFQGTIFI